MALCVAKHGAVLQLASFNNSLTSSPIHEVLSSSVVTDMSGQDTVQPKRPYATCLQRTFLAYGEALISRSAFAPLSKASGSKEGPRGSFSQSAYEVPPAVRAAASPNPVRQRLPHARSDMLLCGSSHHATSKPLC